MVSMSNALRMLFIIVVWFYTQLVSAAILQITVESTTVELGKPVWLTVTSNQTAESLDMLDLSPWQKDFVLPRRDAANLSDVGLSQHLRLRLYPLRKGSFTLPAIHFLNEYSNEMTIRVNEAIDPKNHAPIDFRYTISTLSPWQQQQVVVNCSIITRDEHALFEQPTETISGLQLLPMQEQHSTRYHSTERNTFYTLGWVLVPSRSGQQQLQLPPIQYLRDGIVTHQFYLPPLTLDVQPLPAWLPATIPVGTVNVTGYSLSDTVLSTSVLSQSRLQLRLEGVAPESVPAYQQQLRSDSTLQFYSAQQQLVTTIDSDGIAHQLTYDIPLIAKRLGIYRLPPLRLQYFEPVSGTLKTVQIPGPRVVILNGWIKLSLLLIVSMTVVWLLRLLQRWGVRYWQRYQAYRQALCQLREGASVSTIKRIMQVMAEAEGWPANLTYRQWQSRMQTVAPMAQALPVHKLYAANYGRRQLEIAPIVQQLMQICKRRRLALW